MRLLAALLRPTIVLLWASTIAFALVAADLAGQPQDLTDELFGADERPLFGHLASYVATALTIVAVARFARDRSDGRTTRAVAVGAAVVVSALAGTLVWPHVAHEAPAPWSLAGWMERDRAAEGAHVVQDVNRFDAARLAPVEGRPIVLALASAGYAPRVAMSQAPAIEAGIVLDRDSGEAWLSIVFLRDEQAARAALAELDELVGAETPELDHRTVWTSGRIAVAIAADDVDELVALTELVSRHAPARATLTPSS